MSNNGTIYLNANELKSALESGTVGLLLSQGMVRLLVDKWLSKMNYEDCLEILGIIERIANREGKSGE